jgi:ribosome-associated protein
MNGSEDIVVTPALVVPRSELTLRASRSGGPGGQHVNVTETRVELTWNVAGSPSLSDEQRATLLEKLGARLDSEGTLRLVESRRRSQHQNREAVVERFARVIAAALYRPPPRRKTRPTAASREARLEQKRRRTERKRGRTRPADED